MKRFQRTLALLLAILMLLAALSVPALAASYKVATLKTGTWYKLPSWNNVKTVYKLKLAVDSIVTLNWKNNKTSDARIYFYDNKKAEDYIYSPDMYDAPKSGTTVFAFSKGTYYIQMYENEDKPTTQIKITVKKAINQANYCRAKAVALKANQTVNIAQTADYNYNRWYKIIVPRKKTVTITTTEDNANKITLYDSRLNEISCASGSTKVISEEAIPKGTYFICVSSSWINEYLGNYITLKWN